MQLQALPLDAKVLLAQQRIREWYNHFFGDVYISFSGGKDSTVLAHLVHEMYPEVPLVFANTGLEYPEIQAFARKMGAEFVRPKMSFSEVISTYGYPLISKETAEAIHAARRIVHKNVERVEEITGGGYTDVEESGSDRSRPGWKWAAQKRDELGGGRAIAETASDGNGRQKTGSSSTPPRGKYYQKNQRPENGQTEPKNNQGKTVAHGERLTGADGGESLLPG